MGFWGFGVLGFWVSTLFDLGDLIDLENPNVGDFHSRQF